MAYVHADNAVGPAALAGGAGGPTLTLATGKGAAFAAANPTPSSPMPVAIFRGPTGSEVLQGAVLVTGVSGDALTCAGNVPGYVDPAVQLGDVAASVPLAADDAALWAAVATCVTSTALATTLGSYATNTALSAGLTGKEPAIAGGTTAQYWRGDKSWQPLAAAVLASLPSLAGNSGKYLCNDGSNLVWQSVAGGGSGTVTSVAVASANGLGGSVSNATTTPSITLTCSIGGVLKGTGTAIVAAVAGTDFVAPSGLTSALASYVTLTGAQTLVDKSTQSSGSGDQLKFLNTLGVPASGVDADGNEGAYTLSMWLARGIDLIAGTDLTGGVEAAWPGKIASIRIRARINGASGGFTVGITRTRSGSKTTIATQAVVANNTAPVVIAAGSISDLSIQEGDLFDADVTGTPGTGVQSVSIAIKDSRRNR